MTYAIGLPLLAPADSVATTRVLTAIDGDVNGSGDADKFRIRIWDRGSGGLVYDNQMGANDDSDPTTVLGGGNIVVHK